jgi:hypothetical protein
VLNPWYPPLCHNDQSLQIPAPILTHCTGLFVGVVAYVCGKYVPLQGFSDFFAAVVAGFFGSMLAKAMGGDVCYTGNIIAGESARRLAAKTSLLISPCVG